MAEVSKTNKEVLHQEKVEKSGNEEHLSIQDQKR